MDNTVIIRNTSGGQVTHVGQRLDNEESFNIEQRNILRWRDDLTVSACILAGDLTVNDGDADLPTPEKGLEHLRGISTAPSTRFWKKSTAESSTTSTAFQQKVRLNMDVTASGTYRMGYTANIWNSGASKVTSWRVQVNDATPNVDKIDVKGTNESSVGGFHYQILTSGSHTLDMDYKTSSGGTATIAKARLEYWRELSEMEEV